jgi:preprotein translocase subunit SecG
MAIIVNILLVLFIPVCILLILMVLLQAGKGSGLSGAFGGLGGNQPFLGARGTVDFLSKLTIYLAIGFMSLALILSMT